MNIPEPYEKTRSPNHIFDFQNLVRRASTGDQKRDPILFTSITCCTVKLSLRNGFHFGPFNTHPHYALRDSTLHIGVCWSMERHLSNFEAHRVTTLWIGRASAPSPPPCCSCKVDLVHNSTVQSLRQTCIFARNRHHIVNGETFISFSRVSPLTMWHNIRSQSLLSDFLYKCNTFQHI